MDEFETQLLEAIHAQLRASPALSDELASLGVDSVKMADFIMAIEERFDIRVDQDIWDVETVALEYYGVSVETLALERAALSDWAFEQNNKNAI